MRLKLLIVLAAALWVTGAAAQEGGLMPAHTALMGPTSGGPALGVARQPANTDVTGLGTMSTQNASAVAITGGTITGLPTPVVAADAATKSYVDSSTSGINVHPSAALATTAQLPTYAWTSTGGGTLTGSALAALVVDGVTVTTNQRILVKNEPNSGTGCNGTVFAACNGAYTVSQVGSSGTLPYILLRATTENTAAQWTGGDTFLVAGGGGTTNNNTSWTNSFKVTTLNTNPIIFNELAAAGSGNPWLINGVNIFFNTGNVGIGTSSPGSPLTVVGTAEVKSTLQLDGATSGSTSLVPAAAASGTLTLPAVTDTVAVLGTAQTFTAAQTFNNNDLLLKGSSTGTTTFQSQNSTATNFTLQFPPVNDIVALLGRVDQVMSGGVNLTSVGYGTGSLTVDCGKNPSQFVINGGAFTITAPASDGQCTLLIRNNASAGAVTFSGFTVPVGQNTTDVVNGHLFTVFIWRTTDATGAVAGYSVQPMQ